MASIHMLVLRLFVDRLEIVNLIDCRLSRLLVDATCWTLTKRPTYRAKAPLCPCNFIFYFVICFRCANYESNPIASSGYARGCDGENYTFSHLFFHNGHYLNSKEGNHVIIFGKMMHKRMASACIITYGITPL